MASIWAIADLHLSFGVPGKSMDVFGNQWHEHYAKVQKHWLERIKEDDLVLLAGDFSWALRPEEVKPDLEWLHALPGTKVMIKGNHDYWWGSISKARALLPPSIHLIQNDAFHWRDVAIAGARLWDTQEYTFDAWIEIQESPVSKAPKAPQDLEEAEKIFARELQRLELSLKQMHADSNLKIAMTHYPPIGPLLHPTRAAALLEHYEIDLCIFGHLHSLKSGVEFPVQKSYPQYFLTACDYLNFTPLLLHSE